MYRNEWDGSSSCLTFKLIYNLISTLSIVIINVENIQNSHGELKG